jgi:hypothetical protein
MRSGILVFEVAHELEELFGPSLLKDAHEGTTQCFSWSIWYLCHCSLRPAALLDVAASYLLELKVSCNVGGNEDIGKFSIRHEELRHEVDVPVVGAAILLPWFLALRVVAIFLEELIMLVTS